MTLKKLSQNLALIAFGIVMAVGLSYVNAAVYSDPTATPPEGNTPLLLNVSSTSQEKTGGIGIGKNFSALQNAQLDGKTFFGGVIRPATGKTAVSFGGADPAGVAHKVALAISGGLDVVKTITSSALANATSSQVCSDTAGKVILCSAIDMCKNISGEQKTVPVGYVRDTAGNCNIKTKRFMSRSSGGIEIFTNNIFFNGQGGFHAVVRGDRHWYYGGGVRLYQPIPWVGTHGIDNGGTNRYVVNQIPGIHATNFGIGIGGGTNVRLLDVIEKGKYDIKISSKGRLGIKGKFDENSNWLGVSFFIKINNDWIRLAPPLESTANENYGQWYEKWPLDDQRANFGEYYYADTNAFGYGGNGEVYSYIPYEFNFEKSVNLNPGEFVEVYTVVYGMSHRSTFFFNLSDFNHFTYLIEPSLTTFDITLTPQP